VQDARLTERILNMRALLKTVSRDKKGVTAIEYGLIAGLIAIVIIVGVQLLGANLAALFNSLAGTIGAAV
jgi:pilus assembly protein Flp/PilA